MRKFRSAGLIAVVLFLAGVVIFFYQPEDRDVLYQVSVLSGLMRGDYDGKLTLDEIRRHGDFGIGTFDRLEGEGIELDGIFYQAKYNGRVDTPSGDVKSPFAMATFFDKDADFFTVKSASYTSLKELIDSHLPTKNIPYAIKIEGKFSYIKVRSVEAQKKPYLPLSEAVKDQAIFEFDDIEGTLVGFRMPEYMQGVNIPGYHMHFLSSDKKRGGHLFECTVDSARVSVDNTDRFVMALPKSADFYKINFSGDMNDSLFTKK